VPIGSALHAASAAEASKVFSCRSSSKNEPGAAGKRKHSHDSHPNVSTCNAAQLGRSQVGLAPKKVVAEAGSKIRREASGKGFIAVRSAAPGSVPPVPVGMVRDCG
jgi:hypothetical protein